MKKLMELGKIGSMDIRNRIVMPPMCTAMASDTGAVTRRLINYYGQRAKGGVGLIIVEATSVDSPLGKLQSTELSVDDDRFIAGLHELTEPVHAYGAKIALQLNHAGRQTKLGVTGGIQPVSSSDVPYFGITPRPLRVEEITSIVEKFAEGARRAKAAGFDAIELHGAHGYLISQFLSPYANKRTDLYGNGSEGRMRFASEIIGRVKEKVGDDFPIIFRLSADEHIEGGLTLEDTMTIAQRLEENGVDAVHISAGISQKVQWVTPPMAIPRGCNVHFAEAVNNVVNIPVIVAGRINDPELAEKILQEGKADFVAMGRALIADPELPKKIAEGRLDDIVTCIADNRCSELSGTLGWHIACTLNPITGKEGDFEIRHSEKPRKILVIGGGPGGMEAARIAALKGHDVTLFERSDNLGGQLLLSSVPPYKEEIKNVPQYYTRQLGKLGVKVKVGVEVTPNTVKKMKPDVVVVATGALPLIPDIPGIKGRNVVTAWDVLAGKAKTKDRVVVAGGGQVGCETAEFLAEKGKEVIIVEMLGDIATDMEPKSRILLLERFREYGIKVMTNSKICEISEKGLVLINRKLNRRFVETDTVVLALGSMPNKELAEALSGKFPELYTIGDCVRPRKIIDAIREGFRVAVEI